MLADRAQRRTERDHSNLLDEDPQEMFGFLGALNAGVGNGFVGDLRARRYAAGLSFAF